MSWRVLIARSYEPDLTVLSPADRAAILEDLADWIAEGAPRSPLRSFAGPVLFEDSLRCGFSVAYFVNDADQYIAVIRIRLTRPQAP